MSGPNLARSQAQGIDLIGPLAPVNTPQDRIPDGITWEQFEIDLQNEKVTCPAGQCGKKIWQGENMVRFQFPKEICQDCELRPRCCTGKGGRTIGVSPYYEQLQLARQRQKTEEFKRDYHKHRSGVEGSLSALIRGNGLRISRYLGQRKRQFQAVFTGCAANLDRVASWQAGKRPQKRKSSNWSGTFSQ